MQVSELHAIMKDEFTAVRIQLAVVADLQRAVTDDVNTRLPVVERGLADVRSTLYDPALGLQKQVTLIGDRQAALVKNIDPGNRSERRANWIAAGALLIAFITLALMIIQLGGCTLMPQKTNHIDHLDQVDTRQEHQELVKEITAMVKDVGRNARIEITGDRTYVIEPDGSIFMLHGGERRAVSQWRRADEWEYFEEDVKHNRLRERLAALK